MPTLPGAVPAENPRRVDLAAAAAAARVAVPATNVPYNVKRPKGLAEEAARQEEGEREKLLGDG